MELTEDEAAALHLALGTRELSGITQLHSIYCALYVVDTTDIYIVRDSHSDKFRIARK